MKIMSYNIQSCRDYITRQFDPTKVINVIKEYEPDILGLNEVRSEKLVETNDPSWFNQTKTIADAMGYKYYFFAEAIKLQGYYGNAIISKYPILNPEIIPIPDPLIKDEDVYYESRCILKCNVNGYLVLITHLGLANKERELGISLLKKIVLENFNQNIILMGDFNMEENHPLMKEISTILIDSSTKFKTKQLSFPSINPVSKIDYIFTSSNIDIISSSIINKVASDHFPIVANIK